MNLHSPQHTLRSGPPLAQARGAVILLHGRGSSAEDIAGLADAIPADGITWIAPSATHGTWYPQRFFVPLENNEPWLSSALEVVDALVAEAHAAGIPHERIGIAGFSQGACLSLEYATRHPRRYGLVAGLSGGVIGLLDTPRAAFDLLGTPTLVACAERDPHIPLEFVEHSARLFSGSGADVTKQIFRGGAHTVFPEEITWLRDRLAGWLPPTRSST